MEKLNIKAGQPIKFIGTTTKPTKVFTAGTSRAIPNSKFEIIKEKNI